MRRHAAAIPDVNAVVASSCTSHGLILPSALSFLSLSSSSSRARAARVPPAKSLASAPPSSNHSHPKLPHLPSSLPSPLELSSDRRIAGNRGSSGHRPSMAIEPHLNVELHHPATVFLVQRLKSKLGEALMLVLSSFLHVPPVSALDSWCRRRRHAVARCELHARVPARVAVRASSAPLPRPSRRPTLLLASLAAGDNPSPRRRPRPGGIAVVSDRCNQLYIPV